MAASGMFWSPQIPPATAKTVMISVRNLLRTLASMMRSISDDGTAASCCGVGEGFEFIVASFRRTGVPCFYRALHFRLGIDEKICAVDDAITFFQPAQQLEIVSKFFADFDKARLDSSFALVQERQRAPISRQHGAHRDH